MIDENLYTPLGENQTKQGPEHYRAWYDKPANKYFASAFVLFVLAISLRTIIDEGKLFYTYQIERSTRTKGVLTKAQRVKENKDIKYDLDVSFYATDKVYSFSQRLKVSKDISFVPGDSVDVMFNAANPHLATLTPAKERYLKVGFSSVLIIAAIFAVIFLLREIYVFIRKKVPASDKSAHLLKENIRL